VTNFKQRHERRALTREDDAKVLGERRPPVKDTSFRWTCVRQISDGA
jgi:hypothetical protein